MCANYIAHDINLVHIFDIHTCNVLIYEPTFMYFLFIYIVAKLALVCYSAIYCFPVVM